MNILFRCDGSVEIGMGHVVRCLALADELHDSRNCDIFFATRKSELGITKIEASYPVFKSNKNAFDYGEWMLQCIRKSNAQILILDVRDGLPKRDLIKIKKLSGVRVVTIDDPEDKRLASDLAFYPPVPQLKKMKWNSFNGKLFVGWEYVLLRKEFSKTYPAPNNISLNILISMGGTDKNNMTLFVINALKTLDIPFFATIVLGPGYQYEKSLVSILRSAQFKYSIHNNPNNIAKLMSNSDLGIISFGQTAYELASIGIPAMYLCISEDHFQSSKLFVDENIGISMNQDDVSNAKKVEKLVLSMISEKRMLEKMSARAKSINISNLYKVSSIIIGQTNNA